MTPDKTSSSSKKTLIGMLAVFVLPVILAKVALDNEWFNRGATNKGQLIAPTLNLSNQLTGVSPKWRLLYVMPENCDASCENALFSINQVWLALGKNADRAEALVLTTSLSDQSAIAQLGEYPNVRTLSVDEAIDGLSSNKVYVVDTQYNAMLFYAITPDKAVAVMESRNMLADMRKLLKLSRIG